ncbi:MAG: UvrD-helicase domain-containing protein [Leptospirales bacterium]
MVNEDTILENLNEPQKEAVRQTEGPVLILAGAGSGKTRTIVHRIAYLIHVKHVSPRRIVAVTFTNKASQEMKTRTYEVAGSDAEECLIRTYHSLGLFLLRRLAHYIGYPSDFTIWDDIDQMGTLGAIVEKHVEEKLSRNEIKNIVQSINSFKDQLISPSELSEKVDLEEYQMGDQLQELYHLYEQKKIDSKAVDFADLLYQTVKILRENPEALVGLQARYDYFLVDEYQDTNHAQYVLIKLLSSGKKNLCVVGDDDQAIYTWRGADISNILDFAKDYSEAKVVKLEENYRSTQHVLDLANSVIRNNSNRMDKSLWTQKKEGKKAKLFTLNSDRDESNEIGNMIEALQSEVSLEDIAVLYRTNTQSRLIEEALIKRRINYRVFGGPSFFNRKEIKDLLSYLRLLVNPFDEASFVRIVNTPNRGIGEKTLEKIMAARSEMMDEQRVVPNFISFLKKGHELPLSAKVKINTSALGDWMEDFLEKVKQKADLALLLEDILDSSGLRKVLEDEDNLLGTSRMENVRELKNSLLEFTSQNPDGTLSDYLQEISLFSSTKDSEAESGAVNLMTIHNAKGLEFDSVIIAGLDENIFPHRLALKRDLVEDDEEGMRATGEGEGKQEERRLLYVAITRARRRLLMTRAQNRYMGGYPERFKPSVFIAEMDANLFESINKGSSGQSSGFSRHSSPVTSSYRKKPVPTSTFNNTITAASASSSGSGTVIKSGMRVRHPKFGAGKVFSIEGTGDARKINIFFDDKKSRKFVLKYANLERV